MNARLQKLMDRSFIDEQGEHFDPERFAELIVQECAQAYHQTRSVGTTIEKHFRNHLGLDQ